MAFPFLGLFLLFLIILTYRLKKNTRHQNEVSENFWARENEANSVRRKDISNLPYINIPFEKFPIGVSNDEEIQSYEKDLKNLADRRILNLSGQSNTDLKLTYGPANLPALSEYDENYTRLLRTLVAYAKCLQKNNLEAESIPVLEFGVSIGSDIRANYTMLADIYLKQHNTAAFDNLITQASNLESVMKSAILEQLHDRKG